MRSVPVGVEGMGREDVFFPMSENEKKEPQ